MQMHYPASREFNSVAELRENYRQVRARIRALKGPEKPIPPEALVEEVPIIEPPPISIVPALVAEVIPKDVTETPAQSAFESSLKVRRIQRIVCGYFNQGIADMLNHCRRKHISRARMIAFYFCREMTPLSYPQIGRFFGGFDHSSVLHGVWRVAELCEREPPFSDDVEIIRKDILGT